MVFTSLTFIFLFLPLVIIFYFLKENTTYRNFILFVFSIIFYAWGEPVYIIIMFLSTINDYVHALLIDKFKHRNQTSKAKWLLLSSILINLGLLGVFKYGNFIIFNINSLLNLNFKLPNLTLPIGISFYTFQTMSYTIDVYRNEVEVQRDFLSLGTYVSMFPQLIAGPIVRYSTIEKELKMRTSTWDNVSEGIQRFIIGLSKKVLIANQMAILADTLIGNIHYDRGMLLAWIGIISYSFQIYYDFSGYSDMAIGLGKIFGFNFLENFNYPYISKSVTEFWRRWHISLGTWFRDYVYIPIGGNRVGKLNWLRNVVVVWFLTGLWHGASWNFVMWGLYYGLILVIEKFALINWLNRLPKLLQKLYTYLVVLYGWVLFRIESVTEIKEFTKALVGYYGKGLVIDLYDLNLGYLLPFVIVAFIGATPIPTSLVKRFNYKMSFRWTEDLLLIMIFILSVMYLVNDSFNPFIYYRF